MIARYITVRACWIGASVVSICLSTAHRTSAAPFNLAPDGDPILGAGVDTAGSDDIPIVASGIVGVINDQDIPPPGPFNIRVGRSVDTFAGAITNAIDFVGILFDSPVSGVNQVRVQNFAANDGGWWGPDTTTQNGVPLAAADLTAPEVQVTNGRRQHVDYDRNNVDRLCRSVHGNGSRERRADTRAPHRWPRSILPRRTASTAFA